jgi:predicted CoA-binding protein
MLKRSAAIATSSVSFSGAVCFSAIRCHSASASAGTAGRYVNPSDKEIAAKLANIKTLVVLGLSEDPKKPSYAVIEQILNRPAQEDKAKQIQVIPVRPVPEGKTVTILGFVAKSSVKDVPADVLRSEQTLVNVFRKSSDCPAIIDELLQLGARNVWLQHHVVADEACAKAKAKGMSLVVQDRCLFLEHQRLLPEQWE